MTASSLPLPRRSHLGLELSVPGGDAQAAGTLRVEAVDAGSPAERAGVALGDGLMELGRVPVSSLAQARRLVARLPVSVPTRLLVQRAGARLELWATAEQLPLETMPRGRVALDHVVWAGHRLRAIWTLPEGPGPYPAIWLLPGAAWLSEERALAPGGSLLELVRGLTSAGFATLRVDRSGLGDSEGPLCVELDLDAELAAWRAVRAYFVSHPDVHREQRFLYARSLGGLLAPLLADASLFRAVAVWGTSARRWDVCMHAAARRQYGLAGQTGATLERTLDRLQRLQPLIYEFGLTPEQAFQKEPDLRPLESENFRGERVYRRTARFFQQLVRVDVAAAWRALECPVLALHGRSDWLSIAEDSAHIAGLAPRGEYRELEGIDHMMHARESVEAAFAEPFTGTFTPQALDALVEFYGRQV